VDKLSHGAYHVRERAGSRCNLERNTPGDTKITRDRLAMRKLYKMTVFVFDSEYLPEADVIYEVENSRHVNIKVDTCELRELNDWSDEHQMKLIILNNRYEWNYCRITDMVRLMRRFPTQFIYNWSRQTVGLIYE
jgi:hypothetical protein